MLSSFKSAHKYHQATPPGKVGETARYRTLGIKKRTTVCLFQTPCTRNAIKSKPPVLTMKPNQHNTTLNKTTEPCAEPILQLHSGVPSKSIAKIIAKDMGQKISTKPQRVTSVVCKGLAPCDGSH